jgi:Alkaline phosphatase PhoX
MILGRAADASTCLPRLRVNLDADAAHRVTLWATEDSLGNPLPVFDGSTWDPWAQRLLFTSEDGADGGVWQSTLDFPPVVEDISGVLGRGGYEGIQNDSDGNLWIAEDVSGAKGTVNDHARQPNSFIFRFLPKNKSDLKQGGKLQALQVCRLAVQPCDPIVFHEGQADADILSQNVKDLHTYGNQFQTNWVTVHDTDTDGRSPFDANALAKTKLATRFKRPENAQFRPGRQFKEFFFDATGDTDAATQAGSPYGGFGAIFKLTQANPSASSGVLKLFYRGDLNHTAFDNVAFWDKNHLVFVEDRGDGLHTAHNAYDSGWVFDVRTDYSDPDNHPLRLLALGRDASATIDSAISGIPDNDFNNEGDNEITGIHVSDGNPGVQGVLGVQEPHPFQGGWRVFYTQQHGDNVTWEILPAGSGHGGPRGDDD